MPSYVIADMLGIPLEDGVELYGLTEMIHAAPESQEFDTTQLNNVDYLQPLAGDSSMGPPFVIPLYLLQSEYSSLAELGQQAEIVRRLPFVLPVER